MSNRILLTTDALIVSAPGKDAFTAVGADVYFSSRHGTLTPLVQGSFIAPAGGHYRVIYFGKEFQSGTPIVQLYYRNLSDPSLPGVIWTLGLGTSYGGSYTLTNSYFLVNLVNNPQSQFTYTVWNFAQ